MSSTKDSRSTTAPRNRGSTKTVKSQDSKDTKEASDIPMKKKKVSESNPSFDDGKKRIVRVPRNLNDKVDKCPQKSKRDLDRESEDSKSSTESKSSVDSKSSFDSSGLSDNCDHPQLNGDGTCTLCGIFCQNVYKHDGNPMGYGNAVEKSIKKDMQNLSFPDEVKNKAEEIFEELGSPTKRGKRRAQLVYFCINIAYKKLGQPQDPKWIAKIIGLKQSEITKANSMFAEIHTGYKIPQIKLTPMDLIPRYCKDPDLGLNLSPDIISAIVDFAKVIVMKDEDLSETFPQKVAAAIILYYLEIRGTKICREKYAEAIQLSKPTIDRMVIRIASIDNLSDN